jgi:hypothetical protein
MAKGKFATIDTAEQERLAKEAEKTAYEERMGRLNSLGSLLAKRRDESVQARSQSGIEEDWIEDEDHYEGIDDANRDLYRNRGKPLSPEGGNDKKKDQPVRSRVFLNITRPYVDAAAAKVADMLLPTDDQNWGIEPTPIPSLVKNKQSKEPLLNPQTGQPAMMPGADGQQKALTVGEHANMIINKAKEASKLAETRIDDWLTEANYNHETRKVIEQCARLGTGIIKGPYPIAKKHTSISKKGGLTSITSVLKLSPASRCISVWDLYPDPSCGNDIHSGSFIFEKDRLTKRQLEELLDDPSYIHETLEMVIKQGPQKRHQEIRENEKATVQIESDTQYEIWYYTGFISPQDLEDAGCPCKDDAESIPAIVVMINDMIVKAVINPLDSGAFPYDVMPWQERDGHWAGIGVARQIRTPQRMLNAAVRNLLDNAGLMAGPQIVMKRGMIEPADGVWAITPRKLWYMLEDAVGNVGEAFAAINIPAMQDQLFSIVQYAQKMAEDVTGLPMLLQGQQGSSPETVGGMQMLNNNASTVMRRIARTYDDKITEPHIRRYYEWLILDPDTPEEEKGDYKIVARGSSALVERDIQNQAIAQMVPMVLNPAFGINPKKWIAEYYRSQRLDPNLFLYSEEELLQMQEAAAQQPPVQDPNTIRAQATIESTKIRSQTDLQKATLVQNSDMEELRFKAEEAQREREHDFAMMQMQREMKIMEFAQQNQLSLEQVKAKLADTAMKEKNKRELYNAEQELKIREGSGI